MKLTTNDTDFDAELRKLAAGIRGLEGTADRLIARRNARQRVLRVLRKLRTLLDTKAPVIIKRSTVERLTVQGRINRLVRKGWYDVDDAAAGRFAAAGISVRRVVIDRRGRDQLFIPHWALLIGANNPTKLRQAKKDRKLQRAVVAEAKLREST